MACAAAFEHSQQLTKCDLALPTHDEIHSRIRSHVTLWSKAWIVASDHDTNIRFERTHQPDDLQCGCALKRHHRKADYLGLEFLHEPLDRGADPVLRQDQVG